MYGLGLFSVRERYINIPNHKDGSDLLLDCNLCQLSFVLFQKQILPAALSVILFSSSYTGIRLQGTDLWFK